MINRNRLLLIDASITLDDCHIQELGKFLEIKEYSRSSPDIESLSSCEALLLHSRFSSELFKYMNHCKYIGIRAHNLDYVDVNQARALNIKVEGIPAVAQTSVAEHTFSLIFALAKKTIISHKNTIEGKWRQGIEPNMELLGKKIGIIGYGEVGKRVASIGKALGMEVLIVTKGESNHPERMHMEDVLRKADIITLHIQGTEENKQFINKERISMMKKGALLINTSRGSVLDYREVDIALETGKLGGLGLDVYEEEPICYNPLFGRANVVCSPHIAFYTEETLFSMNRHLVNNVIHYFNL